MFLTIKRRSLMWVLFALLVVGSAVLLITPVLNASATPSNGKTVVIDAGHGGIDGGVVGVKTGTKESDINLAISRSLKHFLEGAGYKVVMTRLNSDGLYSLGAKNKKQSDMEKRRDIIRQAKPDLMVSVHQNYYPRGLVKGAQVFYAPKSENGKAMASVMQSQLNANLPDCTRTEASGDYYILQCSEYPSLLVECGFLSNPEEEKRLVSASYQEKVAYTVFSGIKAILSDTGSVATGIIK